MKIIFIFSCSGMFRNVPACSGMFPLLGFIDGPNSRCRPSSNQLNLPQCRTFAALRAFPFRASKYWNSLSNDIRNSASGEVFKGIARLEMIRMRKCKIYR